tara:strand:- start:750 stop:1178 length:429 start_codon:yes stop_codon:yes gene_type:complete
MNFLLFSIIMISTILADSDYQILDENLNKDLIYQYYKKKQEFIVSLKTGEKYKVAEIISIEENSFKANILKNRLSNNVFYKNNISKRSDYNIEKGNSKMIIDIKFDQIVLIESIDYSNQIREVRNYSFIILGMYFVFSVFAN